MSSWPSTHIFAVSLGPSNNSTSTFSSEEITKGLEDKLWGNIGKIVHTSRLGWIIGPPADKEYAVEPVGVATIKPSDLCSYTTLLFTLSLYRISCAYAPEWIATSFNPYKWLSLNLAETKFLSSILNLPSSISLIAISKLSTLMSVRNPTFPIFTPRIGIWSFKYFLAEFNKVPSPPNTIIKSTFLTNSSCLRFIAFSFL